MRVTFTMHYLDVEEAKKVVAFIGNLSAEQDAKKIAEREERIAANEAKWKADEEDEEEDESPKSAKASKSGSKAGEKSSKASKKPAVVEEDEDDEDEEIDEDEDEDDEDDEKPKGYQKGKANLEGIKELAKALADKGKEASTKKILLEFGAKVVSKIDPADYIPVYTRLLKLLNKSK